MKARLPLDDDLLSEPLFQFLHATSLFFIEKVGHLGMGFYHDGMAPQLRSHPFNLSKDLVADRGLRFDQARTLAIRADFTQNSGNALARSFSSHFHKPEF